MKRGLSVSKACLSAVALLASGCGASFMVEAPQARAAHFALDAWTADPWLAVAAPTRDLSPVRLSGRALVPAALTGAANVHEGSVTGSPVWVFDATSGKPMAQAVTYYDGSFVIDVPLPSGRRAVLVASELVSKDAPDVRVRLMAPVLIVAGGAEQAVTLTPGSTALVAFMAAIAEEQAGRTAPIDGLVTGQAASAHTSLELSSLIAVFEPEAQMRFAQIAEASPELQQAYSLDGLATGIQRFVGRLTRSQVKVTGPRP